MSGGGCQFLSVVLFSVTRCVVRRVTDFWLLVVHAERAVEYLSEHQEENAIYGFKDSNYSKILTFYYEIRFL